MRKIWILAAVFAFILAGCSDAEQGAKDQDVTARNVSEAQEENMKTIYLAGGCFWGVEKFFDQFEGVVATEVGYANGPDQAPSYEEVCRSSGHAETVKVVYDSCIHCGICAKVCPANNITVTEDRKKQLSYLETITNPWDIPVTFVLLDPKQHGLSSPVIEGEDLYIAAKVPRVTQCEEAFGYSFEKMVLYAWSLGIGTTWIGGTMKRKK